MSATCRSCGAAVVWCKTPAGKTMPVDAEPHDQGNVQMVNGVAHVLGPLERIAGEKSLHRSHFATCPQAASHRKAR